MSVLVALTILHCGAGSLCCDGHVCREGLLYLHSLAQEEQGHSTQTVWRVGFQIAL
jgi:hypothetical protein